MSANVPKTFAVTGLNASTVYDFYVVAEDAAGNLSAAVTSQSSISCATGTGGAEHVKAAPACTPVSGPPFDPSMPTMLVGDTGTLYFPSAFIEQPVVPYTITCVSSNPSVITVAGLHAYPLWGTVTGEGGGTTPLAVVATGIGAANVVCNGVSRAVNVIQAPQILNVTYDPTPIGYPTTFAVNGTGLLPNMEFRVSNCSGDSIEVNTVAATASTRYFRCLPTVPVSGVYDIRIRGSRVNLAANYSGGFEPELPPTQCVEESDEFARLRRDYGHLPVGGTTGSRYGAIHLGLLSWETLLTISNRLRSRGVCHRASTPEQLQRTIAQLAALRVELDRRVESIRWVARSELFKGTVKAGTSAASAIADVYGVGAVGKLVRGAEKYGQIRRFTAGFKRALPVAKLTPKMVSSLETLDKLKDLLGLANNLLAFSVDTFEADALLDADVPLSDAERAAWIQDFGELTAQGLVEQNPLLQDWLEKRARFTKSLAPELMKYAVGLVARVGADATQATPVEWTDFVLNEAEELASAGLAVVPVLGPVYDMVKAAHDTYDNVNRAFDHVDQVFDWYSGEGTKVNGRFLAEKLEDKFAIAEVRRAERRVGLYVEHPIVDFGSLPLGATASTIVNVRNGSALPAEILAVEFDAAELVVSAPPCLAVAAQLQSTGSCQLTIQMLPALASRQGGWTSEVLVHHRIAGLPYLLRLVVQGVVVQSAAVAGRTTAVMPVPSGTATTSLTVGSAGPGATSRCVIERNRVIPAGSALLDSLAIPSPLPPSVSFLYGFVDFGLTQCDVGATVRVSVTYPNDLPPASALQLWKRTASGVVRFGAQGAPATFTVSGRTVSYDIVDGGVGDLDGVANGRIVDPVGLGVACNLDLNGDGVITAAKDGLLAARYLAGLRGDALIANVPLAGNMLSATSVEAAIGSALALDVFGRTVTSPSLTQDGMVLVRLMNGFADDNILSGLSVPADAQNTDPIAIRRTVNERCGSTF